MCKGTTILAYTQIFFAKKACCLHTHPIIVQILGHFSGK